jgi:cytoskeletal protein RodZ
MNILLGIGIASITVFASAIFKGEIMDKLRILTMVAALGLAGAAFAQTQDADQQNPAMPPSSSSSTGTGTTGDSDPSSASSPHQRDATSTQSTTEKPPVETSSDPSAASSPHQKDSMRTAEAAGMNAKDAANPQLVGLEVITPAGDPLGSVVDVVNDPTGSPGYVVITSAGKNAIVPYSTAAAMVHDNAVVMDQARLSKAPTVKKDAWKDRSTTSWRTESDRYWNQGKEDEMRTATPNTTKERG